MIRTIIMASGFSRRMGQDKLLMNLQGKPVIQWVIEAALQSGADETVLIYRNPALKDIARAFGIAALYNPKAAGGQSEGIRLAVERLPQTAAYLFLAGDQPLITPATLQGILAVYRESKPDIISAAWKGSRTLPALFAPTMTQPLLSLEGDRGGRSLIDSGLYRTVFQELSGEEEQWDIDTPEELKKIALWLNARMKTGSGTDA